MENATTNPTILWKIEIYNLFRDFIFRFLSRKKKNYTVYLSTRTNVYFFFKDKNIENEKLSWTLPLSV